MLLRVLVSPELPESSTGKTAACAENVYEIWERYKEARLAQLVFCDLSTPKPDGVYSAYNDIRAKLIGKGVPENEIAFIHDFNTESKKAALFGKVRSGQVRVLLGSTQKMGAGTNVQTRLVALHDLDCPWRPSDLQQRLGRIERQGNLNDEVEVFRYVTEGTFDAYLYQLVENKQKFIAQIMTSKSPVRATPRRMDLEVEVSRLKLLKSNCLSQKYDLEDKLAKTYPQKIAALRERIRRYEADAERATANPPAEKERFGITVNAAEYTEKAEAGRAVLDFAKTLTSPTPVPLGSYRGFSLEVGFNVMSRQFEVQIKGTLAHKAVLGTDEAGAITRIDNAIERIAQELEAAKLTLGDTKKQVENARIEAAKPFDKEAELQSKSKRLSELDRVLNMDKSDQAQLVDDEMQEPKARHKEVSMEL